MTAYSSKVLAERKGGLSKEDRSPSAARGGVASFPLPLMGSRGHFPTTSSLTASLLILSFCGKSQVGELTRF